MAMTRVEAWGHLAMIPGLPTGRRRDEVIGSVLRVMEHHSPFRVPPKPRVKRGDVIHSREDMANYDVHDFDVFRASDGRPFVRTGPGPSLFPATCVDVFEGGE